MSEESLRDQLNALVQDRPVTPSPAPLVMAKVRRSRKRRAAGGAAAVALALTGGLLLGLGGIGHDKQVPPANPPLTRLCQVSLPRTWATALADPADDLPAGAGLVAASADGSQVFVQEGNRILRLTDHFRTSAVVMTLPALPAGDEKLSWSVSGAFDGTWLVFSLTPTYSKYESVVGLYAWNTSTGTLRTLLGAVHSPTLEIDDWTSGAGHVTWQTSPYNRDGALMDGAGRNYVMTLASGSVQPGSGTGLAIVGDVMFIDGPDNHPAGGVSLSTGKAAPLPEPLTAFLSRNGSWGSMNDNGTAFSWGGATTSVRAADGKEVGRGPSSWDVWWAGNSSITEVSAPSGYYVAGVQPIAADFAIGTFQPVAQALGDTSHQRIVLIDLRDHSYTPLTTAQAAAVQSTTRSMDVSALPRLTGC